MKAKIRTWVKAVVSMNEIASKTKEKDAHGRIDKNKLKLSVKCFQKIRENK